MLGPFGRDALNDNGERLLTLAEEEELSLVNMFFQSPQGASATYDGPKGKNDQWTLYYIVTRQPVVRTESGHHIV